MVNSALWWFRRWLAIPRIVCFYAKFNKILISTKAARLNSWFTYGTFVIRNKLVTLLDRLFNSAFYNQRETWNGLLALASSSICYWSFQLLWAKCLRKPQRSSKAINLEVNLFFRTIQSSQHFKTEPSLLNRLCSEQPKVSESKQTRMTQSVDGSLLKALYWKDSLFSAFVNWFRQIKWDKWSISPIR